jgi:hypothetical protein
MAKHILIRRTITGGWCGYINPAPKMPGQDSVREWRDIDSMVASLKTIGMRVVVTSDDLVALLKKHGISASKPEGKR